MSLYDRKYTILNFVDHNNNDFTNRQNMMVLAADVPFSRRRSPTKVKAFSIDFAPSSTCKLMLGLNIVRNIMKGEQQLTFKNCVYNFIGTTAKV